MKSSTREKCIFRRSRYGRLIHIFEQFQAIFYIYSLLRLDAICMGLSVFVCVHGNITVFVLYCIVYDDNAGPMIYY